MRLTQFPGFTLGPASASSASSSAPGSCKKTFNPFSDDDFACAASTTSGRKPTIALNVLDAPGPSDGPSVMSFLQGEPAARPTPTFDTVARHGEEKATLHKEAKPLFPTTLLAPMVQPRAKDGARLLYKHPNLPKVGVKGCYELLVGESDRSSGAWLMQFDGAANPNPGPASAGAVLWSPPDIEGKRVPVFESGKYLGKATNNIAEVQGLILGLEIAAVRGARELLIEGDSELIIFHQTGKYKVSDKNLKVWWSIAQAAMMDETAFDWVAIRQVRREFNERADSITKEVLGRKQGFQR